MVARRALGGSMSHAAALLDHFNQRHPWSHNDHFHRWVLRRLPAARTHALDVGCGQGLLASRLATCFAHVDAVDSDADMAAQASARLRSYANVSARHAAFAETTGTYDLVTMVAVLHHMELVDALRHASTLLSSGGKLLVIGLARMATPTDLAYALASSLANPLIGVLKHPRPVRSAPAAPPYPVAEPP